ncbi:MAG: thermonuclease family protein [Bacteroidales bacterium]|nr:thermonuclease family protein [Bacteroidales bacterium]
MQNKHQIVIGDSRNMVELNEQLIHLIVTSPPYWQLKDYGNQQQIGFDHSYEDYINNLNLVWKECYRVLYEGCRLCINIGDQFARAVYYGRYKVIPIREEIIRFCETIGFDYMGAIIWQKETTMNTTGGATVMGSYPYPRNGIIKIDYEFILVFKKVGVSPKVSKDLKEKSILTKEEWNEYFKGHWNFGGAKQDNHIAMFPEELPKRLIKMFTFVGDTVLDPFLGSGTTSLAAKHLNRNSIGYEINKDYLPLIKDKVNINENDMFQKSHFEITKQEKINIDFKEKINELPYIFKDHIKFDKKIDPKKFNFGSKIDNKSTERENYNTVKEIISPNTIILKNDLKVKLLGIKENPTKREEAIKFLKTKTKGQKVFLRFDAIKYDKQDNLLCYLYLSNKTFLNAHLIKNGLADVDTTLEYKYKIKFLNGRKNQIG